VEFGQLENGKIQDNFSGNEIYENSKLQMARLQNQLKYFIRK
jgi:hypothetical protein